MKIRNDSRERREDLTDNRKIIKFAQCKTCKHRADRGTKYDYLGYQKAICTIYDGEDGLYKPWAFNLNENDENFERCRLFEED